MANPVLVLCGPARLTAACGPWAQRTPLRLQIGCASHEVHLRIEHLSRALGARLPDVATDLIELASYVYAADQGISRGGARIR